jgi:hypothetical protein
MKTFIGTVLALGVMAAVATLGSAQGRVNFSGTWTLDKAQSDIPQRMGRGGGAGEERDIGAKMVVDQQGTTMKVTGTLDAEGKERSRTDTYNLAGQETTNTDPRGGSVVSKATWEGDKLVITSTRTAKMRARERTMQRRQEWSLSPDGKTLTIDVTAQTARGERTLKAVFRKS